MTWQSEFRPHGEGIAYILRPEPVIYSPLPKPARKGFLNWSSKMNALKQFVAFFFMSLFLMLGLITESQAALSTGVTTALGDAVTDVTTMGGLALLVVVAVATFRYLKRAP